DTTITHHGVASGGSQGNVVTQHRTRVFDPLCDGVSKIVNVVLNEVRTGEELHLATTSEEPTRHLLDHLRKQVTGDTRALGVNGYTVNLASLSETVKEVQQRVGAVNVSVDSQVLKVLSDSGGKHPRSEERRVGKYRE